MITVNEVLTVAECFVSRTLTSAERTVLTQLCGAALERWRGQLREGVGEEDCRGAILAAGAWTALAGMTGAGESSNPSPVSFTAGDLTIHNRSTSPSACAKSLQTQAEAIMAPFVQDRDFAFLEVAG